MLDAREFEVINSHTSVDFPPTVKHIRQVFRQLKRVGVETHKFREENNIDLDVLGIRKAEGGARAAGDCFSGEYGKNVPMFRPIFWLKDSDKEEYERIFDIRHSECYWGYGLRRTGCVGCPFGRNWEHELEVAKQYEPKLYKACTNVFAPSYEYTRAYWKFRKHKEAEAKGYEQLSLFD